MPDILYHYCSNSALYSILTSHTIRLSDIQKSNDENELKLFLPGIFDYFRKAYETIPLNLLNNEQFVKDDFVSIINDEERIIINALNNGEISSFVLCLSEKGDQLSQWRGYADDGRGGAIGFDFDALNSLCNTENGLTLGKVKYFPSNMLSETTDKIGKLFFDSLLDLITTRVHDGQLNNYLHEHFNSLILGEISRSIPYKSDCFREECEWRIYINKPVFKAFYGDRDAGEKSPLIKLIQEKCDFAAKENAIVPFFPLEFGNAPEKFVKKVILGPKNKTSDCDMSMFLHRYGYNDEAFERSKISYR